MAGNALRGLGLALLVGCAAAVAACLGPDEPTPTPTAVPPMAQTPETDREALVALYNATGGPKWLSNDNWLSDAPTSDWHGVTTDDSGHVIELDLDGNRLRGEIPPELATSPTWRFWALTING